MTSSELIRYYTRIKKSRELMRATNLTTAPSYGNWENWGFVNRN